VGLVKELVSRIRQELGGQAKVIATGGLVQTLASLTETVDVVDPWLTLEGVRLIAEHNAVAKEKS
jgi:type III pantothenate kinase